MIAILSGGCGDPEPPPGPCDGAECGPGPRLALTAQGDFGHISCSGDAIACSLDFGALRAGTPAESWTTIRNTGDARLHLGALVIDNPAFEVAHPAVELDPGEALSFRIRLRIDEAGRRQQGILLLPSDAVNGADNAQGCPEAATRCVAITVALSGQT